jgi:hypothetical protein
MQRQPNASDVCGMRNGILLQHATTATRSRQQRIRPIDGNDVIATSFSSGSNDSGKPRGAFVIPR